MEKRLYRDPSRKMIAGVCAGLADYLAVDVTVIRVIFLLALVLKGVGVIPYIVLWIVLPKRETLFNPHVDYTIPPQGAGPHVDYTVPPPFSSFSGGPQPGAPFAMPPKKRSGAGLIVGIALVLFGSFFLLDEFEILPDLDMERLWPIVFIILGVVVIFSGRKTNPWEKNDWHKTETEQKVEENPAQDKPEDHIPGV